MDERRELIQRYQRGADALMAALAEAPKGSWGWKPAPTEWSIPEILWHCAECEAVFHTRIRTMWIGPNRTLVAFDQDDWAAMPGYVGLPVDVAVDVIRSTRRMTSLMLARLPDEAWNAVGMHTESGRVTFEAVVAHAAGHLDIHARQIRDNVEGWHTATGQDEGGNG